LEVFSAWASDHLIRVEAPEGPLPPGALASWRQLAGTRRLVGLGDSRHDTREQHLMKALLARHLIEDLGFRVLILEESFPHAEALDRYVSEGLGDPEAILSELAGWYLWGTEEMLEFVRWIRRFNAGRDPAERVWIFGTDVTAPRPGVLEVLRWLQREGAAPPPQEASLRLDLLEGDDWPATWQRYGRLTGAQLDSLREAYQLLVERVAALETRASPPAQVERMRLLAEIGRIGNAFFSSRERAAAGAVREEGMAHVTMWILEKGAPGRRAILWANNLHVATGAFRMPQVAAGRLEPMGAILKERLGPDYLAIGGSFGAGAFPADLPPGERTFPLMAPETMDGALARLGVTGFLLDLRRMEEDPRVEAWLRRDRVWRAQDFQATLIPAEAFEAVYFVERVSRARPTRSALERFRRAAR
jgi:erythromycin esterase